MEQDEQDQEKIMLDMMQGMKAAAAKASKWLVTVKVADHFFSVVTKILIIACAIKYLLS